MDVAKGLLPQHFWELLGGAAAAGSPVICHPTDPEEVSLLCPSPASSSPAAARPAPPPPEGQLLGPQHLPGPPDPPAASRPRAPPSARGRCARCFRKSGKDGRFDLIPTKVPTDWHWAWGTRPSCLGTSSWYKALFLHFLSPAQMCFTGDAQGSDTPPPMRPPTPSSIAQCHGALAFRSGGGSVYPTKGHFGGQRVSPVASVSGCADPHVPTTRSAPRVGGRR